MKVRTLLGYLHDSQSTGEATYYADQVVTRWQEDPASVREFVTCGHVSWDTLLAERLEKAGVRL